MNQSQQGWARWKPVSRIVAPPPTGGSASQYPTGMRTWLMPSVTIRSSASSGMYEDQWVCIVRRA